MDDWHKGKYNQHSNEVKANFPDRTKQIVFKITKATATNENAMDNLKIGTIMILQLIHCSSVLYLLKNF